MTTPAELRERVAALPNKPSNLSEVASIIDAALAGWEAAEERYALRLIEWSKTSAERDALAARVEELVHPEDTIHTHELDENGRHMGKAVPRKQEEWAALWGRASVLEKALREIANKPPCSEPLCHMNDAKHIARAALSGSEPPSIPGSGDGMHGEDR